jgi:hypothetical protein
MPALQRSSSPRGVRFYMDTFEGVETIMFLNVIDACTRFGPRPAVTEDAEAHADAWSTFEAGTEPLPPGSAPLVTFETPEGADVPAAPKVRGSKAPA